MIAAINDNIHVLATRVAMVEYDNITDYQNSQFEWDINKARYVTACTTGLCGAKKG